MAAQATGPVNAPPVVALAVAEDVVVVGVGAAEEPDTVLQETSVIAVENQAMLLRTVNFRRMLATTVAKVVILPRIARSPRRSGSSYATTAANQGTWPVTATMQMSRNAILVESLGTSRKTAPK